MTEISSDSLDTFIGIDDTVFVGHIDSDDHVTQKVFIETASKYRAEFTFGIVSLIKEQGLVPPTVTCHLKDGITGMKTVTFTDAAALEKFVIEASRPVIGELTPYNQQRLLNVSKLPTMCHQVLEGT